MASNQIPFHKDMMKGNFYRINSHVLPDSSPRPGLVDRRHSINPVGFALGTFKGEVVDLVLKFSHVFPSAKDNLVLWLWPQYPQCQKENMHCALSTQGQ